ncbi:MAG: extracellular solute-binding protein [Mesorhizobium sp.]|uniref:ABC transporter substrate-binding protein n=1 Tax=Mesorhizobium sp. TaxID=1871066 RepID=UPI000FE97503|nr:extracellular solute-binding protein [Mesorhizobium sp.]RWE19758.1 MAG: extracellular solute-binding protein [Mesorhizobium sp.]
MEKSEEELWELRVANAQRNVINRRRFHSMAGGLVALSLGGMGSAWASGEASVKQLTSGTITLGGWPDWIGKDNIPDFRKAYPDADVRLASIPGEEDRIAKLATDPAAVDIMLLVENDVQRLIDLGVSAPVDLGAVPNYANIDEAFKVGYAATSQPRCVTTDYGKTGFGYRRDIVKEDLKSWADVWKVAEKYKGKITFLNQPQFVIGTGLIVNGDSISSTDGSTVRRAADKIIEIKPYLKRFVDTDISRGLVDGSVAIAMSWDYDIYLAQQENENIVWVAPEDGIYGYLDVWAPVNTSERLPVVWKFFDFFFQPRQYANFVNTLGTASCMEASKPFIDKRMANSEILNPSKEVLKRVQYPKPLGEGQRIWDREWLRIQAA